MADTILIADDHEGVRSSISSALKEAGFKSIEAVDGESALRAVKKHSPSAILIDIVMPGKDGIWACREIRKLKEHRSTPIMICTSRGAKADVDNAISCGANDYIVKPFHPDLLVRKIKRLLALEGVVDGERRGAYRRDAVLTMIWHSSYPPPTGVVFKARVINLSVSGVAFRHTPEPPIASYAYEPHSVHPMHPLYRYSSLNPDGESIHMRIDLPGQRPLEIKGVFVYILREGDEEVCGVQFTDISQNDHRRLSAYVMEDLRSLIDSQCD